MARPLRIQFASALYHVTVRGNERRAIFRDDRDRQRFLARLADCVEADRPENGTGGLLKKSMAANPRRRLNSDPPRREKAVGFGCPDPASSPGVKLV